MTYMKNSAIIVATGFLTLCFQASAQDSVRIPDPLLNLRPAQKESLDNQASSFFSAAKPAVATAAKSTVTISYDNDRISYGTVVLAPGAKQPAILTKWSEVARARHSLMINTSDGKQYTATVSGVYPDHDLALLTVEAQNSKLSPLDLSTPAIPKLGNFILLAQPDGNVKGFGVVSVQARSLRESDRAYLGVEMDFATAGKNGVSLKEVMPNSAASKAGLHNGDVILTVDNTAIVGAMEMRNILQRLAPGSEINIRYRRGNAEKNTIVHLGSRDEYKDIHGVSPKRMNKMERMGTVPNRVRTDFPNVIQSDMPIQPDEYPKILADNFTSDCGGPVVDLEGKVVGIVIARGSRIKTYIIPTSTIRAVLATQPKPANENLVRNSNRRSNRQNTARNSSRGTPPRASPADQNDAIDRVRRLLGEIDQNNQENAESLRKIEKMLKGLKKTDQPDR